jgi:tetratricopeptide (TPR) repeat protein
VIGYTVAFTLGYNLIADPLMSLVGLGGMRWQLAMTHAPVEQRVPLIAVHVVLALAYLTIIRNTHVRLWFSELTRPYANQHLKDALKLLNTSPASARLSCLVGILFEQAGMRYKAKSQLKTMKQLFPFSPFSYFLDALVSYSKRDYKTARRCFLQTSDFQGVDGELKASLLAAGACAAFADNDLIGALNLCERALEFDDRCLVSRMVKVDVLLRQGSKAQAGDEILHAMQLGLSMELAGKVPLDIEEVYNELVDMEERSGVTEFIGVPG